MAKEDEEDATLATSSSLFVSFTVFVMGRLLASGVCRTGGRAGAFPGRTGAEPSGRRRAAGEADHARTSLARLTRVAEASGKGGRGTEAGALMAAAAADMEVDEREPAMCVLGKAVFVSVADGNTEARAAT